MEHFALFLDFRPIKATAQCAVADAYLGRVKDPVSTEQSSPKARKVDLCMEFVIVICTAKIGNQAAGRWSSKWAHATINGHFRLLFYSLSLGPSSPTRGAKKK